MKLKMLSKTDNLSNNSCSNAELTENSLVSDQVKFLEKRFKSKKNHNPRFKGSSCYELNNI